ncbi:hypothetical protein D3C81_2272820 [compost metagenome]
MKKQRKHGLTRIDADASANRSILFLDTGNVVLHPSGGVYGCLFTYQAANDMQRHVDAG